MREPRTYKSKKGDRFIFQSELADSISDAPNCEAMKAFRKVAITPDAIARAIAYAAEQPVDVDVSELIVRPATSRAKPAGLPLSPESSTTSS